MANYDYDKSDEDVSQSEPVAQSQHADPGAEFGAGSEEERAKVAAQASSGVWVVGPNPDTDNAAEVAELQRRVNEPDKD